MPGRFATAKTCTVFWDVLSHGECFTMGRFTFHNVYNKQFVTQDGGRIPHDRRQMLRDFESDGKNPFTLPCFQITNIFMNDFSINSQ